MKLADMHITDEEKKDGEPRCCDRPDGYDGPDYPWGLGLNLDGDTMAKLGLTEMPKIGEVLHLEAIAKVNSLSQNSSENDPDDNRNVGLQIMLMGVMPETTAPDPGKLYDGAGARKG